MWWASKEKLLTSSNDDDSTAFCNVYVSDQSPSELARADGRRSFHQALEKMVFLSISISETHATLQLNWLSNVEKIEIFSIPAQLDEIYIFFPSFFSPIKENLHLKGKL